MKTPEQMAEKWSGIWHREQEFIGAKLGSERAFLAGYQAGRLNSEGVQAAKDQLADADKVMPQWISVKERLPEEGEEVLIFGQYLNDIPKVLGVRSRYKGDQDWKYTWEGPDEWVYRENDVTHWMPLPAPPEK